VTTLDNIASCMEATSFPTTQRGLSREGGAIGPKAVT
jgi:hypothetical protein